MDDAVSLRQLFLPRFSPHYIAALLFTLCCAGAIVKLHASDPDGSKGVYSIAGLAPVYIVPSSCPANDGTSGAPSGSAQYPSLLSGYSTTIGALGCNAAGVNYAVGPPSGQSFTDPSASPPTGTSYNSSTHVLSCTTSGALTLNGYYFNDVSLVCGSGTDLTITNSKFLCSTNCIANISTGVIDFRGSGNLSITKTTINGGSPSGSNCSNQAALIFYAPGATTKSITLEYDYFLDAGQQRIELAGNSSEDTTVTDYYNLIENFGWCSGAHVNYLQTGPGTYALDAEFNTVTQAAETAPGEAWQFYNGDVGTSTMVNPTAKYNTVVTGSGTALSAVMHGNAHSDGDCSTAYSTVTGTGTMTSNYFDLTGVTAGRAFYPSCSSYPNMWGSWIADSTSNKNMVTGAAISFPP